jgi:uncharacterized membrane protein
VTPPALSQAAAFEGLGFLPGDTSSQATGVSADGSVVVGLSCFSVSSCKAVFWDPTHGVRSLQQVLIADGIDLTGWTLSGAEAVSPDGNTIVGSGTDLAGKQKVGSPQSPSPLLACW